MGPCIKCTKRSFIERSVIERSVLDCGVSKLFFEFYFEIFFDYPLGAGEHFRAFSTSGGFGASVFEHFSTPGGFGASNLEDFRRLEASERAFSSILDVWRLRSEDFRGFSRRAGGPRGELHLRRQEAPERPFSSIFDVWRLRSEDFRGFSRRAGGPRAQSHQCAKTVCVIFV